MSFYTNEDKELYKMRNLKLSTFTMECFNRLSEKGFFLHQSVLLLPLLATHDHLPPSPLSYNTFLTYTTE